MNVMKKRLKEQKGFTLVELLAVIVILGIIAAIAVPSIGGIIAKSKFDASKADAVEVLNAAKLYMSETGVTTTTTNLTSTNLADYIDANEVTGITSWSVALDNGVAKITATSANPRSDKKNYTWTAQTKKQVNDTLYKAE